MQFLVSIDGNRVDCFCLTFEDHVSRKYMYNIINYFECHHGYYKEMVSIFF